MVQNYDYVRLNANARSAFLLAIQHAENNGFPIHPDHVNKIKAYNGGPCVVNVHLKLDGTGINVRRFDKYNPPNALNVNTLEQFKHAVNCFCHDGYLNDENLGEV
ncbi:TPA: hypothetical protein N2619_004566 [Salmonella enterica]|uniref:Uncharacterized protein n=1 Tax=Acinetobacter phage APK15 TaxID=2873374 RepID=A0AAE8XK20_9CAUD|nr:hypothetical protein APK15_17 [Acinetobacter phage APK15]HCH8298220.1 hypothetical protein [Salmonella enterica]HCH9460290.1 hypothetical protein [Salmonella enterica]HCM0366611.1 hypothetical protein [Salmonella enterica]